MLRPFQQLLEIPYNQIQKKMFGCIIIFQYMKLYQALNNNLIKMGMFPKRKMMKFVKPEDKKQIQDAMPWPL